LHEALEIAGSYISFRSVETFLVMHELSIALSIIEGASEEARKREAASVDAVYLKLGPLSGVVKDALLFSYELACEGTILEGSRLIIEETAVLVFCPSCDAEKVLESIQRFCCPDCGTWTPETRAGKELELVAIEITGKDTQATHDLELEKVAS
jgi:hydrogenase nickel incorporation protein HypA/HybF